MPRAAVTCPDCGRSWDDRSARFCGACGARLDDGDTRGERGAALVDYVSRRARPPASGEGQRPVRRRRDDEDQRTPRRRVLAAVVGAALVAGMIAIASRLGDGTDRTDAVEVPTVGPSGEATPPSADGTASPPPDPLGAVRCSQSNHLVENCAAWAVDLDGAISSWVFTEAILVATVPERSSIVAVDLETGNLLWERVHAGTGPPSPAYVVEGVVVAEWGASTVAIDTAGGDVLWTAGECLVHGPDPGDVDGLVLTAPCSAGGELVARGLEDGAPRWSLAGYSPRLALAAQRDRGIVLVELSDSGTAVIVRVDAATGEVTWRDEVVTEGASAPSVVPHVTGDGAILFEIDVPGPESLLDVREVGADVRWQRRVVAQWQGVQVVGDLAIVWGRDGALTALEMRDGAPRWSVPVPSGELTAVARDVDSSRVGGSSVDTALVVVEGRGRVVRRSRGTGEELWVSNQPPGRSLAWQDRGRVIVVDGGFMPQRGITVLDRDTGQEILTVDVDGLELVATTPFVLEGADGTLVRITDALVNPSVDAAAP